MQQEPDEDMKSVQDVLQKNQSLLEEGQFYPYEQKIITSGSRFISKKKIAGAITLYFVASKELLKREQINSGFSLAHKIIDLLPNGQIDEKTSSEFLSLYSVAPFCQQKIQFINKVLLKYPSENQSICRQVGIDLINNKKFYLAWRYLVHIEDLDLQLSLLEKWNETLDEKDKEFNLMRYILIKLSLGRDQQAKEIFDKFKDQYPTQSFNYLNLLFKCVQIKSAQGFETLYPKFQNFFKIDPLYKELLLKIGQNTFGISNQQQTQGGLSGLLSSFFQ